MFFNTKKHASNNIKMIDIAIDDNEGDSVEVEKKRVLVMLKVKSYRMLEVPKKMRFRL